MARKNTISSGIKLFGENFSEEQLSKLKSYNFEELKRIYDEDTIYKFLVKCSEETSYYYDLIKHLETITSISKRCCLDCTDTEQKSVAREFCNTFLDNIIPSEIIFNILDAFDNKRISLEYFKHIVSSDVHMWDFLNLNKCMSYLKNARQYYVDDRAFFSSAVSLIDGIDDNTKRIGTISDIEKIVEEKIKQDKKANGVYDIDKSTLEEIDRKLDEVNVLKQSLENLVTLSESQIETLKNETKASKDEINKVTLKALSDLKIQTAQILKQFDITYAQLLSKEKESLINDRDALLADVNIEIEKRRLELQTIADSVGKRIAIELGRIKNLSDSSIKKLQEYVNNDEEIKKVISTVATDEEIMQKLHLLQLPDVQPESQIVVPNIVVASDRVVDTKVNYYFDDNVPFKDRFEELMEKKKNDIKNNGAIYHEKFDDVLTMVMKNDAPYMYGPSGCGKTFMIEKQLAKLLGTNIVTNGYIMYETDVLGFNDAHGSYVPSNFYRCYKFGDTVFLDELDNSVSSSTIILNSFIGKTEDSSYTFPGGETVKRNPNFRIISAGNTRGNGRTVTHNTRQKLDESVMQRLTPIEIDYDNRIEEKILENYPNWYNFAINFREALKNISLDASDGPNYNGTITTRDVEAIRSYKDDKSFDDDKLIMYQVIENKDIDYLNQIINNLEDLEDNFTNEGYELFERFKTLVKQRKY